MIVLYAAQEATCLAVVVGLGRGDAFAEELWLARCVSAIGLKLRSVAEAGGLVAVVVEGAAILWAGVEMGVEGDARLVLGQAIAW